MPEIKRFSGFKLLMFFQDENPPHVHIKGPDFAAKIRVSKRSDRRRRAESGPQRNPPLAGRESD